MSGSSPLLNARSSRATSVSSQEEEKDVMTTAWVICDSDSYLKWGAVRAAEMRDAGYDVQLYVVDNAVAPSASQIEAALAGQAAAPRWTTYANLTVALPAAAPDVLLLACRGPMLELIVKLIADAADRPVVVAGIPGIWMPPTRKGLRYRRAVDVLVVHSVREEIAVQERLPFARIERTGIASLVAGPAAAPGRYRDHIVFAPQALVPREEAQRVEVLQGLVDVAAHHPDTPVILKLRGRADEAQTHAEAYPYPELAEAHGIELPANVVVGYGSLADYLDSCRGFVTVSSTAVLEAASAGVPVLCIDDFGVSALNINSVFEGSGFFGSLEELRRLEFPQPNADWLAENYLHPESRNNWLAVVAAALAARSRGELSRVPASRGGGVSGVFRRVRDRAIALGETDTGARRALARVLRPIDHAWRTVRHR